MWNVIQITLFGLIGAEIDLLEMDVKVVMAGAVVLLCGLTVSYLKPWKLEVVIREIMFWL